jgi:hypothetical protein
MSEELVCVNNGIRLRAVNGKTTENVFFLSIYPKSAVITVFQMAGNQIFNAVDMHARNNDIPPLPKLIHHFGACFLALT